jgi:hypothetical protein
MVGFSDFMAMPMPLRVLHTAMDLEIHCKRPFFKGCNPHARERGLFWALIDTKDEQ